MSRVSEERIRHIDTVGIVSKMFAAVLLDPCISEIAGEALESAAHAHLVTRLGRGWRTLRSPQ